MAQLKSGLPIEGKIEGYSFYKLNGKWVVRRTGGFDGTRIKKHPNYEKVRQNNSEFKRCAHVGKRIRLALLPYLAPLKITYVHNYVLRLMQDLMKLDTVHPTGQRQLCHGFHTAQASALIHAFEFDPKQPFEKHFFVGYTLDVDVKSLVVDRFQPHKVYREMGASYVTFRFLCVGFGSTVEQGAELYESTPARISFEDVNHPLTLRLPEYTGNHEMYLYLLHAAYYSETGEVVYAGMKLIR